MADVVLAPWLREGNRSFSVRVFIQGVKAAGGIEKFALTEAGKGNTEGIANLTMNYWCIYLIIVLGAVLLLRAAWLLAGRKEQFLSGAAYALGLLYLCAFMIFNYYGYSGGMIVGMLLVFLDAMLGKYLDERQALREAEAALRAKEQAEKELRKLRGKEMSVIFQEPMTSLSPVLKIKKQLMEVFDGEPMTKAEKKKRAIELLKMVGIPSPEARMEEYTFQFSGGMRQRAMIAMALGAKPKLLIADEPTTALDVTIQDQIMKLINELKQELGMSVILVTHDLGVIAQMCDRVAVMYAGKVVETGTTAQIFYEHKHPYTEALLRSLPSAEAGKREPLMSIPGTPPDLLCPPKGCGFAARCRHCMQICREEQPPEFELGDGHKASCWLLHPDCPCAAERGDDQ